MDPAGRRRSGRRLPALLRFLIRSDGSSEPAARPEVNCKQDGTILVFHHSPAIPRSLAPTGSIVLYLLREQLSRSPPPRRAPRRWSNPAAFYRYTQQAQRILFKTFESLVTVDTVLGRGRTPELARFMRGKPFETEEVSCAARNIVQCLRLLQTRTKPLQTTCLHCTRPPAYARGLGNRAENAANILEVESNYRCSTGGYTTIDAVSILPPIREFDPPMLCELHQYEFQFFMYQVVCPSWPVPYLMEDMARFGRIGVARWSSALPGFLYAEPSPPPSPRRRQTSSTKITGY